MMRHVRDTDGERGTQRDWSSMRGLVERERERERERDTEERGRKCGEKSRMI